MLQGTNNIKLVNIFHLFNKMTTIKVFFLFSYKSNNYIMYGKDPTETDSITLKLTSTPVTVLVSSEGQKSIFMYGNFYIQQVPVTKHSCVQIFLNSFTAPFPCSRKYDLKLDNLTLSGLWREFKAVIENYYFSSIIIQTFQRRAIARITSCTLQVFLFYNHELQSTVNWQDNFTITSINLRTQKLQKWKYSFINKSNPRILQIFHLSFCAIWAFNFTDGYHSMSFIMCCL